MKARDAYVTVSVEEEFNKAESQKPGSVENLPHVEAIFSSAADGICAHNLHCPVYRCKRIPPSLLQCSPKRTHGPLPLASVP